MAYTRDIATADSASTSSICGVIGLSARATTWKVSMSRWITGLVHSMNLVNEYLALVICVGNIVDILGEQRWDLASFCLQHSHWIVEMTDCLKDALTCEKSQRSFIIVHHILPKKWSVWKVLRQVHLVKLSLTIWDKVLFKHLFVYRLSCAFVYKII